MQSHMCIAMSNIGVRECMFLGMQKIFAQF